jgi:PST family polysaccharide transporter
LSDVRTNDELTEATAVGLRWTTVVRPVTEILLLASTVVLARLIPPSAFGMFAIAVIVQELAVNVPSEGVGTAIVQRREIDRKHLQAGLALSLMIGTGLALLTLLLAAVVVNPIFGRATALVVAATTPWFILGAIVALPMTVLRRRLDFRQLALLGLVDSVVRIVTSIFFAAFLGLDASALVFGGLAGMTAMTALGLYFAPVPLPRWRTREVRDLMHYGGPAMLACFSWAGFRNGDYAIIGARLGAAQAGIYWRGFQLAVSYQTKVSQVMSQVAFPVLARTAGVEEMFVLRQRMVRLLTVVIFPLLMVLVILAPVLVPWVYGPDWEPAVVPTQILAGAGVATVVIDAVGTVLMATGRSRALLGYGVAHFAVYVGAVLVASSHGLVAVCITVVGVHMAFLVVAYKVLLRGRKEATLRFLWADISAASVGCVALVAAALPVDIALGHTAIAPPLHVLVVGSVALVAYLAALRVCFPDAWRDVMALVRRVLPARPLRSVLRRMPRLADDPA